MSLREEIEDDLTQSVMEAPEWREEITHYPGGVTAAGVVIPAIIDRRREEGTNEVDGDGATPDTSEGRRVRATYLIDIYNSVAVTLKDTFLIDGFLFNVIRTVGRDKSAGGSRTLRVVCIDPQFTRQPRLRPTTDWRYRSKT